MPPKFLERRHADQAAMNGPGPVPTGRRVERQLDRDTSAARKQAGGHPHRMAGSHDGMHVSEHHRKGRKA